MSYHHNNGFGGGGFNSRGSNQGGFRSNYSNQGYGSGGGFHQNGPRINETQVPQSKHTIFIRGLHGDITTEEIQDFIGQKVGKISFDFVKLAQDRSKIFVAVRFEKRDEAKEFMETYSDREFMGCRCELSWFRDIRRYCAYQRAKQIRSNSQRRRRRSDSEDRQRSASPATSEKRKTRSRSNRSESRSPSRSPTRSPSKSRSRSPDAKRGRSYRKRSPSRSRSRSRSESSVSSRRSSRHSSKASDRSSESEKEEDVESRTSSRRSSRRSSNLNQKRRRDSEEKETPKKKISKDDTKLPQIPLPPKATPPIETPPTTVEVESPPTNPYQEYAHNLNSQNFGNSVTYAVPMEEEAPPKMIVRDVTAYATYTPTPIAPVTPTPPPPASVAPPAPPPVAPVTPPAALPAFVPRQVGKIEIVMPASLPAVVMEQQAPPTSSSSSSVAAPGAAGTQLNGVSPASATSSGSKMAAMPSGTAADSVNASMFPTTNKLFGHLKAFQSALLSTVRYEPPSKKNEDGDDISSLRLSTMDSSDESNEELKALEREQKLARLTEDQMMRFHIKKKQLETNFRNDCDTYAVVTKALLSKDESLQFGLKTSLLENMDDLYKKMMQRVDDHLDALLA